MIFCCLDKSEKDHWLPQLFDLLYENMQAIAPSGLSYEQERKQWLSAVSPALEKTPRQIILCFVDEKLAGYIQYYIREQMLMVEEVQLKKKYHRTCLFYKFCKHLMSVLPDNLQIVEAYANKRNRNSICLMKKLGLHPCEADTDSPFVHMRGATEAVYKRFKGCGDTTKNDK